MQDFAAIDFETANNNPSSICAVGIVVVRDGKIVDRFYRLVHPAPNYYNPKFIEIHGITKEDTDPADYFPEVWAEAVQVIGDLPLVAHNSKFDEGCLRAAHRRYDMTYPDYEFHCTCDAARQKLRDQVVNHRLPTVAAFFGYDLEHHHHALADAEACAIIALNLL